MKSPIVSTLVFCGVLAGEHRRALRAHLQVSGDVGAHRRDGRVLLRHRPLRLLPARLLPAAAGHIDGEGSRKREKFIEYIKIRKKTAVSNGAVKSCVSGSVR